MVSLLIFKKKNLINLKYTFHKMLSIINNFETINLSDVLVFNRMSCGSMNMQKNATNGLENQVTRGFQ